MLVAAFILASAGFVLANRAAYRAYFSDDDFDKSGWPTALSNAEFLREIVTPRMSDGLFRPIGYLYYRYMPRFFKFDYTPWVVVLQAGHLLNVLLLFFVLRRFGLADFAAASGALLYLFHAAMIYVYWQPQYIFEVLVAMFSLLTLLLYMNGRWILALLTFWLAYKSKEIAVTLPVALLTWEWFFGARRWKRLIPYFAISLNFGIQALLVNRRVAAGAGYALNFHPEVFWHTAVFYASAIAFLPYVGFALALLPLITRDRRVWFGLIFIAALFLPMLVLPSRLESVYWYLPMIGLTVAFAALASKLPRWAVALFFLLWLPLNYYKMEPKRQELLAHGAQARWYVNGLLKVKDQTPPLRAVVYQDFPSLMGGWGIEGALRKVFGLGIDTAWQASPRAAELRLKVPMALVGYYEPSHAVKILVRITNKNDSYISFAGEPPLYQLGDGWFDQDADWRWIAPKAELTLRRPKDARQFEIAAYLPDESIKKDGPATITVSEDGRALGTAICSGDTLFRWKLTEAAPGDHHIMIATTPVRHMQWNPNDLGCGVRRIGYLAQ